MLVIDAERLLSDLQALARIGATPDGGVSRPALAEADLEARAWFRTRAQDAGLEVRQDGAGNLSVLLRCTDPEAKTLLVGSHLDSVPNGGRFDGALGALCGLETVRRLKEVGQALPFHVEAISFTDEEGTWLGLLGSRAAAGELGRTDLERVRGGVEAFSRALAGIGTDLDGVLGAARSGDRYAGFVEVHVEQGTRLESLDLPVGVVTSIVGIRWHRLRFLGEAAHAGTTPLAQRRDALWGACAFVQQASALVKSAFTPGVMNCGHLALFPGAFNIVPARADLALEIRHGAEDDLDRMQRELLALGEACARDCGLAFESEWASRIPAAPLDERVASALERAAKAHGLGHRRLLSFAGHDTQSMSRIMPSGMFFVPSVGGVSHNPKEYTAPEDCVNAGNVMLAAVLQLADGASSGTDPDQSRA